MRKFRNVPTVIDGIKFASKKEAARYRELKLLEKAGKIRHLARQVSYTIRVNGQVIFRYIADFEYSENGKAVVEDVKGYRTAIYRLKKKLMKAVLGIEIRET